jgi:hypothetical protein
MSAVPGQELSQRLLGGRLPWAVKIKKIENEDQLRRRIARGLIAGGGVNGEDAGGLIVVEEGKVPGFEIENGLAGGVGYGNIERKDPRAMRGADGPEGRTVFPGYGGIWSADTRARLPAKARNWARQK